MLRCPFVGTAIGVNESFTDHDRNTISLGIFTDFLRYANNLIYIVCKFILKIQSSTNWLAAQQQACM